MDANRVEEQARTHLRERDVRKEEQRGAEYMKRLLTGVSVFALSAAATAAAAQEVGSSVSEVIVTGTRQTGVRAADSAAPIQVIGAAALTQRTGATDLASALATSVPSLNIQTNGGDTAALAIQAALRGLGPNDTLVLVDGKRRHTTANLAVDGGSPYSGSATVDLSFIPVDSIDHIEVLTDGAAAQYGTDAIAGVVNVILKSASHGGLLTTTGGEYYGGDGETGAWAINKGFNLGDKGFFNVTLEERIHSFSTTGIGDGRFTNSSGTVLPGLPFPQSNVVSAANFPHVNQLNGDPAFNLYNGLYNAGYDLGGGVQLYSFGTYGQRTAQHYENYRSPAKVSGYECLNSNACVYPQTAATQGAEVFPLPFGFDPRERFNETDYSFTVGLRGLNFGWNWDLSTTYGKNDDQVYVVNSANAQQFAALQALSTTPVTPQRTFFDGAFAATEITSTVDLSRNFNVGLASPLNVALGGEERRDTYRIDSGEPASYFGAGTQSFAGYSPLDQSSHARTNYALYGDLAVDPIKNLHVDVAGRYEHYSDFGDTEIGKFTGRYDFNPAFAVRGTVSSGFRAPTLAEEYYSGTNVSPYSAEVQLPANSEAAGVAGFSNLKPEHSNNYSIGFVAHPIDRLQVTADLYEIDVRDRILVSGFIYGTNTLSGQSAPTVISQNVLNSIAARGVTLDSGLSYTGIAVFANAANTRTRGAEITANYSSDFDEYGHVDWSVGINYNANEIRKLALLPIADQNAAQGQTAFLSDNARTALTTSVPQEKLIGQAYWTWHKFSLNLRETIYGPTSQYSADNAYKQTIGVNGITDIDIAYRLTPKIKIDIGAENVFDTIPPKVGESGGFPLGGGLVFKVPYAFAPFNPNGGYYYGRATYTF